MQFEEFFETKANFDWVDTDNISEKLNKLGISLTDDKGNYRSFKDVLEEMSMKFNENIKNNELEGENEMKDVIIGGENDLIFKERMESAKNMKKSIIEMEENNIIKVKRLREETKLPTYGSELASGFDVRAYDCVMWDVNKNDLVSIQLSTNGKGEKGWFIDDNTTVIFKTGLAMACGDHEEVQARARSGYSLKTPMRISNGIGTIDEDFRGEVGIIMDNNGQYGRWFVPYAERVAQLVVCPVSRPRIVESENLDDTQRGEGGYGSTGTK